jgi:hypothetical protein
VCGFVDGSSLMGVFSRFHHNLSPTPRPTLSLRRQHKHESTLCIPTIQLKFTSNEIMSCSTLSLRSHSSAWCNGFASTRSFDTRKAESDKPWFGAQLRIYFKCSQISTISTLASFRHLSSSTSAVKARDSRCGLLSAD